IDSGLPDEAWQLFRNATQHSIPISYADSVKMHIRIESRRMRAFEFFQERLPVAAVPDVVANVIGIRKRQHNQIMAAPVAERARTRGLGFFVLRFAMND